MKPQEIGCQTFRAVFGTSISEQGASNLAHHEQNCATCAEFAQTSRKIATTPGISCERYWELNAAQNEMTDADRDAYWKHHKICPPCKARSWGQAWELVAHIFKE